jgi:hypothetical protein
MTLFPVSLPRIARRAVHCAQAGTAAAQRRGGAPEDNPDRRGGGILSRQRGPAHASSSGGRRRHGCGAQHLVLAGAAVHARARLRDWGGWRPNRRCDDHRQLGRAGRGRGAEKSRTGRDPWPGFGRRFVVSMLTMLGPMLVSVVADSRYLLSGWTRHPLRLVHRHSGDGAARDVLDALAGVPLPGGARRTRCRTVRGPEYTSLKQYWGNTTVER